MLRSNDLIWSFVINNYLLGRDPFPFDLLHWNCDSTRMPAKMHSFYLRNMYMKNALQDAERDHARGRADRPVARSPCRRYFASAIEDHIAPWKATYAGPASLGGKSRFVLSGSGHIAGMINPPVGEEVRLLDQRRERLTTPTQWLKGAKQHEGSWWDGLARLARSEARDPKSPLANPAGAEVKARGRSNRHQGSYARLRTDATLRRRASTIQGFAVVRITQRSRGDQDETQASNAHERAVSDRILVGSRGCAESVRDISPGTAAPPAPPSCSRLRRSSKSIRYVEQKAKAAASVRSPAGCSAACSATQIGSGRGNTAATIVGAGRRRVRRQRGREEREKESYYVVTVRLDNGRRRTITQGARPGGARR